MKKKIVITAVSVFLLALLYLMIFGFSNQTGEESGALSLGISRSCAVLINTLSGQPRTQEALDSMALYLEHPVRKLAHFTEYAVMGVLLCGIWSPWTSAGVPRRKFYLFTAAWVLVSAAADEMHQLFVPGRCGSFADVLLDTAGGCAGILFCIIVGKSCRRLGDKSGCRQG